MAYKIINIIYKVLNCNNRDHGIHILVALHFIPNKDPDNLQLVNHIDGNKTNNVKSNLEWVNHSLNGKHAWKLGLNTGPRKKVYKINIKTKEIVQEYRSSVDASKYEKLERSTISTRIRSKTVKDNFIWSYSKILSI